MRITQKTIFSNFMRDVNKNRSEMAEIQSKLSSGRRVRVPSQDPVAFKSSRMIQENIRKQEQYQGNINSGLRQARLAQDALDETANRLVDIKNLVVRGASDSSNDDARETMADELSGIRESLVNTLNLSYGDRYLFAGTNSADKPFEFDNTQPGGVANNSNDKPPQIVAADGVNIDLSVTGQDIADTSAGDLFGVIGDIEQALRNNDTTAINNLLGKADDLIDHVADVNAKLGNNINRMDYLYQQYESSNIAQKSDVSELVDTDYAQAYSDLQRNQVAYESAMAVHTTMFNNTLLNYI